MYCLCHKIHLHSFTKHKILIIELKNENRIHLISLKPEGHTFSKNHHHPHPAFIPYANLNSSSLNHIPLKSNKIKISPAFESVSSPKFLSNEKCCSLEERKKKKTTTTKISYGRSYRCHVPIR